MTKKEVLKLQRSDWVAYKHKPDTHMSVLEVLTEREYPGKYPMVLISHIGGPEELFTYKVLNLVRRANP